MRKRFFVCTAQGVGEPTWEPVADIYQMRKGWKIKFELAGIKLEDVQIFVKGNCLTIEGVRRDFYTEESANYYSMEIAYNRFRRGVILPVKLDDAQIRTEYKDGMLIIYIQMEVGQDDTGPAGYAIRSDSTR